MCMSAYCYLRKISNPWTPNSSYIKAGFLSQRDKRVTNAICTYPAAISGDISEQTVLGDPAKYVKLYREALAPIPCGRVVPHSCLGDSRSPESDNPYLLQRERARSVSGQSGAFRVIT